MKKIGCCLGIMAIMLVVDMAYACECIRSTPEQYFKNSSAVFIGEFQKARPGFIILQTIDAEFKVIKVFKGELKARDFVTVITRSHSSMCGIGSWANESPGTPWIIYAHHVTTNSVPPKIMLGTGLCNGTSPSAAADEHLKYFDSLRK